MKKYMKKDIAEKDEKKNFVKRFWIKKLMHVKNISYKRTK